MDFLGFVFTPAGYVAALAAVVVAGLAIGSLAVVLTLFYGRRS